MKNMLMCGKQEGNLVLGGLRKHSVTTSVNQCYSGCEDGKADLKNLHQTNEREKTTENRLCTHIKTLRGAEFETSLL